MRSADVASEGCRGCGTGKLDPTAGTSSVTATWRAESLRLVSTEAAGTVAQHHSVSAIDTGCRMCTAHTVGAERVVCLFVAATSTHGLRRGEQTCIGAGNIVHGIVASEDAVGSASGRGSIACCRGLVHGLCRSLASTVGARAIGKLASDADEDKEEECADEATEHDGDYGCFET